MNALELMSRLGGETLNNKIRASVDGKIVILARMIGTEWEYTPEGQELANTHSNEVVAESEVEIKVTRTRKAKDASAEPVAVELADVEPEL
jgi:hypothetical protein